VFCTLPAVWFNDRCTLCCWQGLPCPRGLSGTVWWQPRLPEGFPFVSLTVSSSGRQCHSCCEQTCLRATTPPIDVRVIGVTYLPCCLLCILELLLQSLYLWLQLSKLPTLSSTQASIHVRGQLRLQNRQQALQLKSACLVGSFGLADRYLTPSGMP
jgi:hypothetical protein